MALTRRAFVFGASVSVFAIHARAAEPVIKARQYHNQPIESQQHKYLVALWDAVKAETGGKVEVAVFAQNNGQAGGDPAVLDMLVSGEVEFVTLMGGPLSRIVPPMDIQGLPFAYNTSQEVHRSHDGALGQYLSNECAAKGIHRFKRGLLESGFRHISSVEKPIRKPVDLDGFRIRVPDDRLFQDFFATLGAQPVPIDFKDMAQAFKDRKIDGQENPLIVTDANRLWEVTKFVSMTSHMWSGFNLIANLKFWKKIPEDIQGVIDRNVSKYVAQQRHEVQRANGALPARLKAQGMVISNADGDAFRRKLAGGFYPRWKEQIGAGAWGLLEGDVGKLG